MAYLPDVMLNGDWYDVYVLSGITAGAPLSIQNKSSQPLIVHKGTATPPTNSNSGVVIYYANTLYFTCETPGESLYVKGNGQAVIQPGYIEQTGLQIVDSSTGNLRPATTNDFTPKDSWDVVGYVLDTDGNLTSETQSDGTYSRVRNWTYSTDGSGNVTATASGWSVV